MRLILVGPIALPSRDLPILLITITLEAVLDQEEVERLYQRIKHFAKSDLDDLSTT